MEITNYSRESAISQLSLINRWCLEHYRNYPYLYAADEEPIINPSDLMYVNDPNALVVIARENSNAIALATGIPLSSVYLTSYYFSAELLDKFKEKNLNPEEIWYVGYFLTTLEHRNNRTVIKTIYDRLVDRAKQIGKKKICYIETVREKNHPQKPQNFQSLEPWGEIITGFSQTDITTSFTYPTVQKDGTVKEEENTFRFFIKAL
jgi:hypothetical protein